MFLFYVSVTVTNKKENTTEVKNFAIPAYTGEEALGKAVAYGEVGALSNRIETLGTDWR